MDTLMSPERRDAFGRATVHGGARGAGAAAAAAPAPPAALVAATSNVDRTSPAPEPPFWGTRVLDGIDLERVFRFLALRSLFRLQWGAKSVKGDDWVRLLQDDFMPRLRAMQRDAIADGLAAAARHLRLLPGGGRGRRRAGLRSRRPRAGAAALPLPAPAGRRAPVHRRLLRCPSMPARRDVVAFQAVTMGARRHRVGRRVAGGGTATPTPTTRMGWAWRRPRRWPSTCTAISTRSWASRARAASATAGATRPAPTWRTTARSSPCCPTRARSALQLTEAYQLVPEQSTVAIIAHHPQAKYFAARSASALHGGADVSRGERRWRSAGARERQYAAPDEHGELSRQGGCAAHIVQRVADSACPADPVLRHLATRPEQPHVHPRRRAAAVPVLGVQGGAIDSYHAGIQFVAALSFSR